MTGRYGIIACYKDIVVFMPGQTIVRNNGRKRVCISWIDCKNNVLKMKKYIEEYINPLFLDFVKKFGDHHVTRGFSKTIPIPDFYE